ncbi:Rpn family recombination-promoting nuclease/putative transposase [Oceanobacillus salinisoli]|uniref:Rpn family recombination-promoting nuclease/putative transposase n=1 Tax=Oceanobacillus salinisoli TaxID=2678611 RepID=UPI0012E0D892|nr:Rpn family recombination-promoting nuclease/putative transposase [Oceanobacillus salinisoli]
MLLKEALQKNTSECTSLYAVREDSTNYTNNESKGNLRARLLKRIPLERLMDLKIDYAFKQLFGNEKNKEITVVFLNAILQKTGRDHIKDISFKNTESGGEYVDDKQSRLDLLVLTNADEWINVEIQFTNKFEMIKRSIYYWSGAYRRPFKKKMAYQELRPVIAINILNFNLFRQTNRFHTTYHLYEDDEKYKLTDVMEFHFIEMPKLLKDWKEEALDPWNDVLARWLLMLGMINHRNDEIYHDIYKELEEISMKDKSLRSAFQNWEELSMTPEQYLAYESRLKQVMDEEAAQREAELRAQEAEKEGMERGLEKGIERGIEKGMEQGIEKGIEKGLEKGDKKAREKVARRLLAKGMEIDFVAETTSLPKERIIELQNI